MNALRRLTIASATAALVVGGVATPTLAADNGAVDAQVTVATPCIVVTPGTVDFGTLPFSTSALVAGSWRSIQIQNCGSSGEQIFARGTDATVDGATFWTLTESTPCYESGVVDEYMLRAQDGDDLNLSVELTNSNQLLEQVGAGLDAATDRLALDMPCVGSDGIGEIVSFQAIFTASF